MDSIPRQFHIRRKLQFKNFQLNHYILSEFMLMYTELILIRTNIYIEQFQISLKFSSEYDKMILKRTCSLELHTSKSHTL